MSIPFQMQLDSFDTVHCVYVQCGRSFTSQVNDAYCRTSRTCVMCHSACLWICSHQCVHLNYFNLPVTFLDPDVNNNMFILDSL